MGMIKFFWYKNTETGEMKSDQRMEGYEDKPLIEKGVKWELVRDYEPPKKESKATGIAIIDKNREVFEADPAYVKSCKPKYVQFQDGHKEKYDPTKHC